MIEKLGITPGPWYHGEHGHIVTGFGRTVCQTHEDEGFNFENCKVNGDFIAAAPEMFEALIDAVNRFKQYEMSVDTEPPYFHRKAMLSYIGTIEKATGLTWADVKERINDIRADFTLTNS